MIKGSVTCIDLLMKENFKMLNMFLAILIYNFIGTLVYYLIEYLIKHKLSYPEQNRTIMLWPINLLVVPFFFIIKLHANIKRGDGKAKISKINNKNIFTK